MSRIVAWWSAGAASAIAARVILQEDTEAEKAVVNCSNTLCSEHSDNRRFLEECERWYGQPILQVYTERFRDQWDVFERTGWLIGVSGARCTTELKKNVRKAFQRPDDVHIFGYTAGEGRRAALFERRNPELNCRFPLIERGVTHAECLTLLEKVGIELPAMYRLGYLNNNCIGCVKGGAGYWNKIRVDFPDVFDRMAQLERKLGVSILKKKVNGHNEKVFLDVLDPKAGRYHAEPHGECGVGCQLVFEQIELAEGEIFNDAGNLAAAKDVVP